MIQRQIVYDLTYMCNLKNKQTNKTPKKPKTQKQRIDWWLSGVRGGGKGNG